MAWLAGLAAVLTTAGAARAACPGTKVEYKGRCVYPDTREAEVLQEAAAKREEQARAAAARRATGGGAGGATGGPAPGRGPAANGPAVGEYATLGATSTPPSIVLIDGRPHGRTPVSGVRVLPGRHTVVFTHPEHGTLAHEVNVAAGRSAQLSVQFEGTVRVSAPAAPGGLPPEGGAAGGTVVAPCDPRRDPTCHTGERTDASPNPVERTGKLIGIATGGTCQWSVDGKSQGSGSSFNATVSVGTHTVSCAPPGQAARMQRKTVSADKPALATFKLDSLAGTPKPKQNAPHAVPVQVEDLPTF